jgi:hypothetical protein
MSADYDIVCVPLGSVIVDSHMIPNSNETFDSLTIQFIEITDLPAPHVVLIDF